MAKLKITQEQYDRLLIKEQTNRVLLEAEKDLNNTNDLLMGFAKVMGVKLTNFNLHKANGVLKDSEKMLEIKNIIKNSDKRQGLIDDLNNKGMVDSGDKVLFKVDDIAKNYNKISKENGFKHTIEIDELMNDVLKSK